MRQSDLRFPSSKLVPPLLQASSRESHSVMPNSDCRDCNLPGSSSMEFCIQESWSAQAVPFSRGSSQPRSPALHMDSLPSEPSGKPKNIGVGNLSLLQGIFPTQESNQGLLYCRQTLYWLSHQGRPYCKLDQWFSLSVQLPLSCQIHFSMLPLLCLTGNYTSHAPLLRFQDFPDGSDSKESACNAGDPGSIPVLGRFTGEVNGNPLQYSCLENSMDEATAHGVAKG